MPFARIVDDTDQAPPDGVAVKTFPAIVTVTTPGASRSVVPLIVGVALLVIAVAPSATVTVGGAL